nr:synaptobrevin, longin-like domain protein [Tanacetum cinerariifolium]
MAPLTFADTHNMVAYLFKSDASTGFDQIVDFLNAQVIQKKVVVIEDVIRQDLCLNDADGVKFLPNKEIFAELARMGYEKPPLKLMFYKVFFSAQWKFLIHTFIQCVSAKRIAWNEFSCSMASAIICLATSRKFNFSKYIFDSMVRNVDSPSKFLIVGKGFSRVETLLFTSMLVQLQPQAAEEENDVEVPTATPPSPINAPLPPLQDPIPTPPQAQPATLPSPLQEQPTD